MSVIPPEQEEYPDCRSCGSPTQLVDGEIICVDPDCEDPKPCL